MPTEKEETEMFDRLWNKYEGLGKHMFQAMIEMLTDAALGKERPKDTITDLVTAYFATMNAYDKVFVAQQDGMETSLDDFINELPDA